MSKIKKIDINERDIAVILDSGVSISKTVDSRVLAIIRSSLDKLVGVEVFDLEYMDSIIKKQGDRDSIFFVSKFFLELGALEMSKPIYKYIGNCCEIPCICDNYILDNYNLIDVDNYFTITDIIVDVLNLSNVVLLSNDPIVCDLAIGLGVSFIKTSDKSVIERLNYLSSIV